MKNEQAVRALAAVENLAARMKADVRDGRETVETWEALTQTVARAGDALEMQVRDTRYENVVEALLESVRDHSQAIEEIARLREKCKKLQKERDQARAAVKGQQGDVS